MVNAKLVGQYFLSKNADLTDIQVQKLVYYAYSWYMVKNSGKKLFDEKPEAWVHGPVFRSLFYAMKDYKNFINFTEIDTIGKGVSDFLEIIFDVYGKYSGNELEKLTHSETPWIKARVGLAPYELSTRNIDDEEILAYYGK